MMTTMANNSYWNNVASDPLFDFDELFSTTFNFISNDEYDQQSMQIKEEYDESSSSNDMDQEQLQPLSINSSPREFNLPNLICGVCGAPATGYNFDQITCESCKAFFRRNALKETANLKCRFSGSCVINIRTRRQCTYCRLKKCFDIKMRKDWIRTDEEKELRQLQKLAKEQRKLNRTTNDQLPIMNLPIVIRKKKRLFIKSTNQELVVKPIFTQTFLGYNRNLSDDDRIIINNITNCYQSATDQINNLHLNQSTPCRTLIDFVNHESKSHHSLIRYYKSIPQFNELDIRDRMLLIKWNLVKIVHLHCILMENFQEDPLTGLHMTKWIGQDFHNQMSRTRKYFDRFKEHPLILKLALVVLIFSTNLSTLDSIDRSDEYINKSQISAIQDFYTTALWKYLHNVYGEREAIQSMEMIMTKILHYQRLMKIMEEHVKREQTNHQVNELEICLFRLP